MEQPADIQLLLIKMEQGVCSPEEAALLLNWLAASGNKNAALSLIGERLALPVDADPVGSSYKEQLEAIRLNIISKPHDTPVMPVHRVHFLRRIRWAAAAVFILSCVAIWVVYKQPGHRQAPIAIRYKNDAAPGREGALLTLANGKTILLDSIANGSVANEQGSVIEKTGDGSLRYGAAGRTIAQVYTNTLSTPRARKFRMRLPDGTAVWLNAESSVTFPSAFTGKERKVQVTGEVYFEVVTDKNKPFIVKTPTRDIRVLGTSFNVNTYAGETAEITTLLEGSIELSGGSLKLLLQPGDQATGFTVSKANIEQTMAWKNGLFHFENTDLKTIMRQISRWYDVEVVFDKDAPSYDFNAKLPDNLPVSEVLKLLELTKLVHFEIDGKTIIVKK